MRTSAQFKTDQTLTRTCAKCGTTKTLAAFKPRADRPGKHSTVCYSCARRRPAEVLWRQSPKARETQRRYSRKRANSDPHNIARRAAFKSLPDTAASAWLKAAVCAKRRVAKRGRKGLTATWIKRWAGVNRCPVLGLPFVFGVSGVKGAPHPLSPSLDRIDASKGYTDANTRVVSYFVNVAKNAWSDEQFRLLVQAAASNMRH